ncbi:Golgi apyrase [Extremus antarcticus]|uniref:Golgi apyrase n=1 Tax=Extremus antarcticus TaxID=702011 RepID=A0AAJ0G8T8_9PEZI|nr:Golgi apyrase [Extremus antarcticus]
MGHKHKYGVVLDAGSSGSRVYIYRYKTAEYVKEKEDTKELGRLPKIKTKKSWNFKVKPGISTFGDKPELVGEEHLKELVAFAEEQVPKDEIENTPIFLLATAGMRLLPKAQRDAVLENVCAYFQKHSKFQIPDCDLHIQVIPGETEGLYGWVAANYLLDGFDKPEKNDHGDGHHTYGFLDMGGASAQIAFAPNATEAEKHANDLKLLRLRTVEGEAIEYGVFVTTWLGFGANEARRRYVEHLLGASPGEQEVPDPCLPVGLLIKPTGEEIEPGSSKATGKLSHLIGTGKFTDCLHSAYPLLEKNKPCDDPPCLLNGMHTPAIDFGVNHFVGVSEFWHTTHEIFAMAHKDRAYDFASYQKQVSELCSRKWSDLEKDIEKEFWGSKVDAKTVEEVCFKASWLINMLHEGIGVPRVSLEQSGHPITGEANKTNAIVDGAEDKGFLDPFQAVNKIDGTEVSWTLGKMVLYASSQMPPAKDSMAVGFGSNLPGTKLPSDFQFASGKLAEPTTGSASDTAGDKSWHDRILGSSYSRRIPGLLIFLLILALAMYLLCGRERRLSYWQKVTGRRTSPSWSRRKGAAPGLFSAKLFGNTSPSYERVLEEAADPDDFELADLPSDDQVYSDSSNSSHGRTGRSSGWATPSTRGLSPDVSRPSPKKGYFDPSSSAAAGLGITPFERGGLTVRTESRERLAPAPSLLGRSRTGSPRQSPLVAPLKEMVD